MWIFVCVTFIMFFFTFSMVEYSSWRSVRSTKNMQSRVTFPDFSSPLFIYSKSDTTQLRGVSLRTFVPNCKFDITFHVKHCKSKLKIVYIIPVRIKKRKVKKRGIFPLLHHRISFRYFSFSSFQNSPFTWYSGSCSFPALNSTFKIIILTLRHNSKVKPRLSGTQNHQRFL